MGKPVSPPPMPSSRGKGGRQVLDLFAVKKKGLSLLVIEEKGKGGKSASLFPPVIDAT